MVSIKKTQLIALLHGLPPHTEALDCEDLKGPRSLFGESASVPKPLRADDERRARTGQSGARADICSRSLVLWEDAGNLRPADVARRILGPDNALSSAPNRSGLDVPVSTYIAGRCTSTFNLAWHLLENDLLPEWGAVLCSCQTEGRGQLRRTWHSPRGNLYVSFRLPRDPNLQGDAASLVVGGLLAGAFESLGFPLSLKWPNDLLLSETSKVGGLLLEERNGALLAGLGVNLAESPSAALLRADRAAPAAVLLPCHARNSLRANACGPDAGTEEGGSENEEPLAPFGLWRHLVSAAILGYTRSVQGQSLPRVLAGFSRLLAWRERWVTLTEADGSSFSGWHQGLGETGGLRLLSADGRSHEFFSGSLSLRQ